MTLFFQKEKPKIEAKPSVIPKSETLTSKPSKTESDPLAEDMGWLIDDVDWNEEDEMTFSEPVTKKKKKDNVM